MLVEIHEKRVLSMKIFQPRDSIELEEEEKEELSALDLLLKALSDDEEDSEDVYE